MSAPPVIAIAGGGFSGTMLAVQLTRHARGPLHILLFDKDAGFARGIAYGTTDPAHLLNVRADRMGAFPDRPDDFHHWLIAHEMQWRAKYPALAGLKVTAEGFMPRLLYGEYLAMLLANAHAHDKGVTIEKIVAEVTDAEVISGGVTLTLAGGGARKANRLALALGSMPGSFPFEDKLKNNPRYTRYIWRPLPGSILTQTGFCENDAPVFIIGLGLTMIDAVLTLQHKGYQGKIIALSRHGHLPQPHATGLAAYPPFIARPPSTALRLLHAIRMEVRKARANRIDWRAVIDALRNDTPALWAALPEAERKKLVKLLSLWSTHRHRMPESSAQTLGQLQEANRLEILAGRIRSVTPTQNGLRVELRAVNGVTRGISVAHMLNCGGAATKLNESGHPLLLHLLARGLVHEGPLQMGIAANPEGRTGASPFIYAMGPLLAGERLETIAVPEPRVQAEALAQALLASLTDGI